MTNAELLELCERYKAAKIEMDRYDEGIPAKVYDEFVLSEDALAGATLEALPRLIAENEKLRREAGGLPASIIEALNSGDGTYRP